MAGKNDKFVMPGAEPDELDLDDSKKVDLSFMEETDEEKEAREAAEARKAERDAEAKAEQEEADRLKAEKEAKAKEDEKTDAEKAAEKAEEDRVAAELAAKKEDKGEKKKSPMVPKTRLDEVIAKNKALEAKLEAERAAREARKPEAPKDGKAIDLDALEDQYMDAVMAGEKAKAKELRAQIREEETKRVTAKTDENSGKDNEATALMEAAERVQEAFPALKEGHADFNEDAFKEVIELRDAYIIAGKNPVEALNKAVKIVVKNYDLDAALEETSKKDENVVDLEKKREENTKKKIAANNKQPPEMKGEGSRTEKKRELSEIEQMSDEEFAALPASTLKRMRGDII